MKYTIEIEREMPSPEQAFELALRLVQQTGPGRVDYCVHASGRVHVGSGSCTVDAEPDQPKLTQAEERRRQSRDSCGND